MSSPVPTLAFFFICFYSQASSVSFEISPPQVVKENTEVHIGCSHNDNSLYVMLWYQQIKGGLTLIGYGYDKSTPTYEGQFEEEFELRRESTTKGALIIRRAKLSHSAVYFCAARASELAEAYFGKGTKLTVLESSVVPPTVNVLKPSTKECRNSKDDARRKTIVCVASNFYPDHVSVKWQVGGTDVTRGVVTGTAQRKKGETSYKITSRLTVSAENWNTGGHEFKCIVSFFDGNITMYFNDTVYGEATTTSVLTREKYLKITQTAKLAYAVFIIKSAIYGIFIAYLVWRIQGSFGKLSN